MRFSIPSFFEFLEAPGAFDRASLPLIPALLHDEQIAINAEWLDLSTKKRIKIKGNVLLASSSKWNTVDTLNYSQQIEDKLLNVYLYIIKRIANTLLLAKRVPQLQDVDPNNKLKKGSSIINIHKNGNTRLVDFNKWEGFSYYRKYYVRNQSYLLIDQTWSKSELQE